MFFLCDMIMNVKHGFWVKEKEFLEKFSCQTSLRDILFFGFINFSKCQLTLAKRSILFHSTEPLRTHTMKSKLPKVTHFECSRFANVRKANQMMLFVAQLRLICCI